MRAVDNNMNPVICKAMFRIIFVFEKNNKDSKFIVVKKKKGVLGFEVIPIM
jgi:hypothetical protein